MEKSVKRRRRWRAIPVLAALAILAGTPARGQELVQEPDHGFKPFNPVLKFVQLRAYSASGTHQCGSEKGRSCVVSGSGFSNCNDANITLQIRDCCPMTPAGGKSSGFVLNYCLPDRP